MPRNAQKGEFSASKGYNGPHQVAKNTRAFILCVLYGHQQVLGKVHYGTFQLLGAERACSASMTMVCHGTSALVI
jgi:hypothetical protein